ncbi:hypothetical protein ACFYY8_31780 [Streptosporangium sp. NPDC001559]|uniref:hypothetical protein n=1 Tax=Streptosporangium sp. NPDC001559 TaxID=3366187 RepID=UPI0036EE3B10
MSSEVSVSEPEADRWRPVERPEPEAAPAEEVAPQPPRREPADPKPAPEQAVPGTPAGHLAVGVGSVLTLGGLGLYNAVGVAGLAAGGAVAVAGAGGYGYWRLRRRFPRRDRPGRAPRNARTWFNTPSGPGPVGRRMTFGGGPGGSGGGRTSTRSKMPSGGGKGAGPGLGSRATGRHVFGGRDASGPSRGAFRPAANPTGGRPPRSPRAAERPHRLPAAAFRAAQALHTHTAPRRAERRAAAKARDQAVTEATRRARRAVARWGLGRIRAVTRWVDRRTGHHASRRLRSIAARLRTWDKDILDGVGAQAWAWLRDRIRTALEIPEAEPAATPEVEAEVPPQDAPQPDEAPADPAPETAPSKPGRTRWSGTRLQGASTMANSLVTHATELPTIASEYETDDMMDVKTDLEMLRELPLQVGAAIRIMTERLNADYPIDAAVTEHLHTLYEGFCALATVCDDVSTTFQEAHEADIARHLQPRNGEQKWNVR